MSLQAMSMVWKSPYGGSVKLTLLALADWCDDSGENLYPSIKKVAKKVGASESQTRRIMHGFINDGVLEVVGNHHGGAAGQTRRYRLNLDKLAATTGADATPSTHATPSANAHHDWRPCALPLAPMTPYTLLTVKETSVAKAAQEVATQVLAYLNKKASRAYRPVDSNLRLIAARLKEGATIEDCNAVIDAKVAAWSADAKMTPYLRPATLFNAEKFAQYIGEIDAAPVDGGQSWE
jgi:uncharacterized phage protein (TIGR02220 family)